MRYRGWVALGVWLSALGIGVNLLAAHQFTPGRSGPAPQQWAGSGAGDRPNGRSRLVMFVHPHCPCTPASLRNFAAVTAGTGCEAVIYVAADEPTDTPNGRLAARIHGAEVRPDPGGGIARRCGAMTSGHVFVYTAGDRLAFEGGITDGRGHEGPSPGRLAVSARLSGTEDTLVSLPVFGCPLQE